MKPAQTASRAVGSLMALARGDRNGGPLRMALRLAESLVDCQRFDPKDALGRYLTWWHEDGYDSGPTAGRVLELVSQGMDHEKAVIKVDELSAGHTAGCNPAHRCAPLRSASNGGFHC